MEQWYGLRLLGDKNNDVDTRCVAVAAKQIDVHSPLDRDIRRGGETQDTSKCLLNSFINEKLLTVSLRINSYDWSVKLLFAVDLRFLRNSVTFSFSKNHLLLYEIERVSCIQTRNFDVVYTVGKSVQSQRIHL